MIGGVTWNKKENMANESYFISRNEDRYDLPTEDARIMSRYTTSIAASGTDEAKIYKLTGDIKAIIKSSLSPNENADFYKTYLETSMLSMQGLMGGGAFIHQCPFLRIAFGNFFKKAHVSKVENRPNVLFGKMDITSLIWCPPEEVSEAMVDCSLVAAKTEKGKKFPSPVPLRSSMATLRNNTWSPFDPDQGQISSELLDKCFSGEVQNELRKQVSANKHLKPFADDSRSDVGTIVLLCGIWFQSVEDLNKHIESVHGNVNLAHFPKAHKVSSRAVNTTASAPLSEALRDNFSAGVVKIRGANQGTMEQYVKGKNYEKPTKNDSTEQVLDKMRTLLTRVNNDYSVFDSEGRVMVDQYGDIVTLFTSFFEDDPTWMRLFDQSAQAITENWNILGKNNTTRVSREDILTWVKSMWDKRTTRTFLRQVYLVHGTRSASYSDDMAIQLNEAVRVVREIFGGTTVEMRLPVKFGTSDKWRTATVNISYFLIVQKLIQDWPHSDNKLWELVKKLKLDKILLPRGETDEAAVLGTLSEGIQQLREKLRSSLPTTSRSTGVRVNYVWNDELLDEIREEDIQDGYTPEDFATYQENVYKAWTEEFPEAATKPTEQEILILRKKNKFALDKDSVKGACGRAKCQNKRGCFTRRKKKQEESKTLYITQRCIKKGKDGKNDDSDTKTKDVNTKNVKCVRTGDHIDVTLKNQVLRLYEEDANGTVPLVANADGSELRIATSEEAADDNVPKVTAKLRGAGLIGNTTNEILLSVAPSAPSTNWLAVRQVTISNTAAAPEMRAAYEETDVITKPKAKKTRRSKRNRAHPTNSPIHQPSDGITKATNKPMDSFEDEPIGRRVDLQRTPHEKNDATMKTIKDEGLNRNRNHLNNASAPTSANSIVRVMDRFMDSLEDESIGRIVNLQSNSHEEQEVTKELIDEEAIGIDQEQEFTPLMNNVLMANFLSDPKTQPSNDNTRKTVSSSDLHDKTFKALNNNLYQRDSENRRCSREKCPLPSKCFQLREKKQLQNKILYNSWTCLDVRKRCISLRLPHHAYLLTEQRTQLEDINSRAFSKDYEKSECSRPRCGNRRACFQKRSLEQSTSNQFYSNQLCHKEGEEDEPITVIVNGLLDNSDKAPAETSNEDFKEVQLQRVNKKHEKFIEKKRK